MAKRPTRLLTNNEEFPLAAQGMSWLTYVDNIPQMFENKAQDDAYRNSLGNKTIELPDGSSFTTQRGAINRVVTSSQKKNVKVETLPVSVINFGVVVLDEFGHEAGMIFSEIGDMENWYFTPSSSGVRIVFGERTIQPQYVVSDTNDLIKEIRKSIDPIFVSDMGTFYEVIPGNRSQDYKIVSSGSITSEVQDNTIWTPGTAIIEVSWIDGGDVYTAEFPVSFVGMTYGVSPARGASLEVHQTLLSMRFGHFDSPTGLPDIVPIGTVSGYYLSTVNERKYFVLDGGSQSEIYNFSKIYNTQVSFPFAYNDYANTHLYGTLVHDGVKINAVDSVIYISDIDMMYSGVELTQFSVAGKNDDTVLYSPPTPKYQPPGIIPRHGNAFPYLAYDGDPQFLASACIWHRGVRYETAPNIAFDTAEFSYGSYYFIDNDYSMGTATAKLTNSTSGNKAFCFSVVYPDDNGIMVSNYAVFDNYDPVTGRVLYGAIEGIGSVYIDVSSCLLAR